MDELDLPSSIAVPRGVCDNLREARRREWLCTNGLGGYAMGSIAGSLERSYHGLLIEAQAPPLGRTLRLAKLDPSIRVHDQVFELDTNLWRSRGASEPGVTGGVAHLEEFSLRGSSPTWIFLVAGCRVRRTLWMVPGQHTTAVEWTLLGGAEEARLSLKAIASTRNHHHKEPSGAGLAMVSRSTPEGLILETEGHKPLRIVSPGVWEEADDLYTSFYVSKDDGRGLGGEDSHRCKGSVDLTLIRGEPLCILISTESGDLLSGEEAWRARAAHDLGLLQKRASVSPKDPPEIQHLVLSADQFLVQRALGGKPGRTVMAGYPWFGDWGRDTMIALPGLALSTGRPEVAAEILRTFAGFVDQGMLPNRFPGPGEPPEYNTVDATLWFFRAVEQTCEALGEQDARALEKELLPVLSSCIQAHKEGTRYGIKVDKDGLLTSGADGVQLTWMDARFQGQVITPRRGKPVEINGLWLHALHVYRDICVRHGKDIEKIDKWIRKATKAFKRFWNASTHCLYDVLDLPGGGNDPSVRPNQLMALALPTCPLSLGKRKKAIRRVGQVLLTSHGLRSLSPEHPEYEGRYAGPVSHRDPSYHQGTTWGWLMGPWVRARVAAGEDLSCVRKDLGALLHHLSDALVGSVSEIFDGDAPFVPRGAPAQAWSVAELLASWDLVQEKNEG